MKKVRVITFCTMLGLAAGTVHANEQTQYVLVDTGASQLGLPFEQIAGRQIRAGKAGSMLLILSPHEQAVFLEGRLVRYMCIEGEDRPCRAQTSPAATQQFGFSTVTDEKRQGMTLRILDAAFFDARPNQRPPSPPYALTHVDGKPYTVDYDAQSQNYQIQKKGEL